ncbi:ABC transporter permease [Bifidobacterium avesanii]|uniref:FtsX-like permease family protein n=1 Tax=Bifidobacterium avesanii TaxID=1798157 RepID=A0A7K3TGS3_9BIFI|nr:FtsX-like permease family protein [Bifidobacterium avesanii]KAB8293566.1 ABC transporter permease [Bifidobacterium avesanii]NEG78297.1 FtsX-like permease family protein [Bifidobacterium avesanii]
MAAHVSLGTLPLENLRRKPLRTAALLVVVTMLTIAFYAGSMLSLNLDAGLTSMEERMGADLMVVPQNTGAKAEALLTNGDSNTFYFTNDISSMVAKADGVAQESAQTYISSLTADCCDEKVQIIGFDPATDFVIEPWITSQFDGTLADGQIVAGANINVSADGSVKLYGHRFPVVAQLGATGTSLDNSVFVNMATVPQVVRYSAEVGHPAIPEGYEDKVTSAVLVKVAPGYDARTVASNIERATGISDLGYVYPGGVTASTKSSLGAIMRYVAVFVAIFWAMGVAVLLAVFSATANERKREFASLRIMGATRGQLVRLIVGESTLIGAIGGVAGVGLSSLAILPFSALIGRELQLPYLQTGLGTVALLVVLALAFAVATGALASLVAAVRLSRPEAYLTLREGE